MKLTKADATSVEKAMANTEDRANLGFREYVAYQMRRDIQGSIKNQQPRYPNLNAQELEWKIRFEKLADWPNGWYLRGIARRFATSDLAEFALFVQMYVRQAVLNYAGDDDFTEIWPMLRALAISDQPTIDAYLAVATLPLESGPPEVRLLHNCIYALLKPGIVRPESLQREETGKTGDWLQGLITSVKGVLARDPGQVAEGLEQHLVGFRKAHRINPLEKIVSLEAHGVYRLAERIDASLVREFNPERELPWDREFHDWSSSQRPAITMDHLSDCPEPVATALVTVQRPSWID